jgi:hypothetical protein
MYDFLYMLGFILVKQYEIYSYKLIFRHIIFRQE